MFSKSERGAGTPIRAAAQAALELAAEKSWDHVSIHAIARKADIGLDDLYDMGGKVAVLAEIERHFDRTMGVGLDPLEEGADINEKRERLVEVMMQRFDAMENHREAMTSILEFVTSNPAETAKATARRLKTARWALEASQIDDPAGVRGVALAASFMRANGVWLADEAPNDRTLASIDKDLRSWSDWMDDFSGVGGKVADFFAGLGDTISGEFNKRRGNNETEWEDVDEEPSRETKTAKSDDEDKDDPKGGSGGAPPPPL